MHPNHHQYNYSNNHKTAFTSIATSTTTTTTSSSHIPVHNANNRLPHNTIFHNNQYTFSLNRNGDGGGYLDPRPLSAASLYGDGPRVTRGTKSDIGVPCRRQTSSKASALLHNNHSTSSSSSSHTTGVHKSKLPSVKSDFLLSYLNNNNSNKTNNDNVMGLDDAQGSGQSSITSPYYISGGYSNDYLEAYRNESKRFYASSGKLDEHANRTDRHQTRSGVHKFGRHSNNALNDRKSNSSHHNANTTNNANSNNVGPLLYLDSFGRFNDKSAYSNAQYQSMQSVSKSPYNA